MTEKRRLTFVSPRFLFPTDSGGKIRTTQILRGLVGGAFHVSLLMPSTAEERSEHSGAIDSVCDELVTWKPKIRGQLMNRLRQFSLLLDRRPVSVAADFDRSGADAVRLALLAAPDVVVFDFPHSAVLAPDCINVPSVMFTHNIETEIFKRHIAVAKSMLMRAIWKNQCSKMERYEKTILRQFDAVVAVSGRDCDFFMQEWGVDRCRSIPTGVDTEFFRYEVPDQDNQVVFCGSMDWMANIDGVEYFHDRVWPLIRQEAPGARMKVVGRMPPVALVRRISSVSADWEFTGFVDDIRIHAAGAAAFVIPLRVGGGTRIKAFEAMAMGSPVVSTSVGIEGLPVEDGIHYVKADTEREMADSIIDLLHNVGRRRKIAEAARELVESTFGFRKAAAVFEDICLQAASGMQSKQ